MVVVGQGYTEDEAAKDAFEKRYIVSIFVGFDNARHGDTFLKEIMLVLPYLLKVEEKEKEVEITPDSWNTRNPDS